MKKLLFFILLIFNLTIQAQEYKPFNDAIEIGSNNNLKFYLNSYLNITDKHCGDYYMIAQFDKENFSFKDSISIFYKNNKTYLKGTYKEDKRNGAFTWFYKTGKVQIVGEYTMGERSGIWEFYYPKGNLYKKVAYKNNQEFLIDFYTKKGEQKVKDGNGYFKDEFPIVAFTTKILNKIEGTVFNGVPDGKWELETEGNKIIENPSNNTWTTRLIPIKMCTEYFSNGIFTKGISYSQVPNMDNSFYYDNYLSSFTGRIFIEKLNLIRISHCDHILDMYNPGLYNKIKLDFYNSELKNSAPNNWFLVNLKMNKDLKMKYLDIYSTAPEEITSQLRKMIQNIEIPKTIITTSEDIQLYFSFAIRNHKIYFQKEEKIKLFKETK